MTFSKSNLKFYCLRATSLFDGCAALGGDFVPFELLPLVTEVEQMFSSFSDRHLIGLKMGELSVCECAYDGVCVCVRAHVRMTHCVCVSCHAFV